jgi:hypothetical protein
MADVFTASTTFWVMESIRLDLGYGSYATPDRIEVTLMSITAKLWKRFRVRPAR